MTGRSRPREAQQDERPCGEALAVAPAPKLCGDTEHQQHEGSPSRSLPGDSGTAGLALPSPLWGLLVLQSQDPSGA